MYLQYWIHFFDIFLQSNELYCIQFALASSFARATARQQQSQPYRSLMPVQHFEPGDFTVRNRFGRTASQEVGCGEEREAQPYEPIIDHTKQSWYFSKAGIYARPLQLRAQSFFLQFFLYQRYKFQFNDYTQINILTLLMITDNKLSTIMNTIN
ncbi:Hypothetical_protein [Hexamita inflata]|uniref:Hypothetical_protein n=1 Tax=Hexamita inflata TaxID=28002 RepID=A0AA86V609_9EUKA|nr:Hypothetical protein HINF_LOCUS65476 [Hexamita inflata]